MTCRNIAVAASALALSMACSTSAAWGSELDPPFAEASHYGNGQYEECVTITFEGGAQGAPVGTVPETGTEFTPGYVTLNSGPFSGNPSGTTVALINDGDGTIKFDPPRSSVSTFYASANTVTLEARDAADGSIGSDSSPVNAPPFDTWSPLNVDVGNNLIASVVLTAQLGATLLDDFTSCVVTDVPPLTCEGFAAPVGSDPVMVRKNRALPFRAELFDVDGLPLTDADIVAPPVIQVLFSSEGSALPPVDVTEDTLPAGQSSEGNRFSFQGGVWAYFLSTKDHDAPGTYTVKILSGDQQEYRLGGGIFGQLPTCEGTFVVEE
jgi:hypothetical protein